MSCITVGRVLGGNDHAAAVEVIEQVFAREKKWITSASGQIPDHVNESGNVSWFLARVNGRPAGVLRLLYDPPLELPDAYAVNFMPGIDIEHLKKQGRYVEIGRFMILGEFRRNYRVALRLMREATAEVMERDYSHFITDVFEDDQHSPLNFHTRVLGFEAVGRHLFGDLNCSSARIILTLDILKLYSRVKDSRSRIYLELIHGIREIAERRIRRIQSGVAKG
ncbi:GNAT family N-acetyltransferase [Chlorobium phaeobacteroides]|jgi:hypothetical protein|uniref:N-acetyltransferase domain-containing protein n=1 Tax=Chlorobium phaeobacteroides (strain DSM 266 / SMG 266 / 2430) TaxID=290317 RepID=A1BFA4_CHLPD|nr:GNAT family N-acetyltransferase [Chlorobium phaeobacteroides]ABL65081.1 conserved hypothetical protein [Chlorobium phaeobacteroides DSM 266]MBV5327377.1 GNAT family N-acetyltransferase [Chlorobium sp.]